MVGSTENEGSSQTIWWVGRVGWSVNGLARDLSVGLAGWFIGLAGWFIGLAQRFVGFLGWTLRSRFIGWRLSVNGRWGIFISLGGLSVSLGNLSDSLGNLAVSEKVLRKLSDWPRIFPEEIFSTPTRLQPDKSSVRKYEKRSISSYISPIIYWGLYRPKSTFWRCVRVIGGLAKTIFSS